MSRVRTLVGLLCGVVLTRPVSGQGGATHVLIVSGLSADPAFATVFAAAARPVFDSAKKAWHVADSSLIYLSEDPALDPARMTGKATKAAIGGAFEQIARRAHVGDLVLVLLIGHGAGEMETSAVNVPGPDPVATDYAGWLSALDKTTVVFVNAATGSGDFWRYLSGRNRIIVTATKTSMEKNESIFAEQFAQALTGSEADADKDGHVSVLEAFNMAKTKIAKVYESTNRMQTEHATLTDSSGIAARIAFGGISSSIDPRVSALIGERRVLEASVDSLRRIKATTDSLVYSSALERLLLQIAAKTKAIKALQPAGSP